MENINSTVLIRLFYADNRNQWKVQSSSLLVRFMPLAVDREQLLISGF